MVTVVQPNLSTVCQTELIYPIENALCCFCAGKHVCLVAHQVNWLLMCKRVLFSLQFRRTDSPEGSGEGVDRRREVSIMRTLICTDSYMHGYAAQYLKSVFTSALLHVHALKGRQI